MSISPITQPDYVPVRMLNEVVYCPRLCYLEWVQGEFTDNAFVLHGRAVHRHVDEPGGSLPEPEVELDSDSDGGAGSAAVKVMRSLTLSSERLGIIARIDRVEHDVVGSPQVGPVALVPIETKRGEIPKHIDEQAYEPERVQLCAQGLLLREQGYACNRGEIY